MAGLHREPINPGDAMTRNEIDQLQQGDLLLCAIERPSRRAYVDLTTQNYICIVWSNHASDILAKNSPIWGAMRKRQRDIEP